MAPVAQPDTAKPPRLLLSGAALVLLALGSCTSADQAGSTDSHAAPSAPAIASAGPALPAAKTPAAAGASRLQNLTGKQVTALLGQPVFRREENPAQIWRYRSHSCVLELMLYKLDSDYQVRRVEARDDKFRALQPDACLNTVMAERRSSGASNGNG